MEGTRLGSSDGYHVTLDAVHTFTRESVDASLQAHPLATAKKSLQGQTRQTNRTRFGAESPISLRKIIERLEDTQKQEIQQVKALKKLNAKSHRPVTNVDGSASSSRVAGIAGGNTSPREQPSPGQNTSVLLDQYNTRASNLKHSEALSTSIRHTSVPGQRNGLGIRTQPARTAINSAGGPGFASDTAPNENFLPSLKQPRAIANAFKSASSNAKARHVSVSEARAISPLKNVGETAGVLGRQRLAKGKGSRSPSPLESISKEPSGEEKVLHLSNVFPFFNLADQKPGSSRADETKSVTANTTQEKIVGQIELTTGRKLEVSPTALQMHLSVAQERRLIDQTRRQAQSLSRRDHEVTVLMDKLKKKPRKTASIAPMKQTQVNSPRRGPFDSHMSAVKQEVKDATSGNPVQGSAYLPSSLKKSIKQKQIVTQIKQMQRQIRKEHQKLSTIEQPLALPPSCQVPPKETAFQRDMALWKQELDENFGDKFRELTEQKAVKDKKVEERKREELRLKKLHKQERLQKKRERQECERQEKLRKKREAQEQAQLEQEAAEAKRMESGPTTQPNAWQFASEIELDQSVEQSSKNDQEVFSLQAQNYNPPLTSDGVLDDAEIATFKSEPPMELNSPDAGFYKDGTFSPELPHRGTLIATANRNIREDAAQDDQDGYSEDGYEQDQDHQQEEGAQTELENKVQTAILPSPPGTQPLRSSQNQGFLSEVQQHVVLSEDCQTQVDIVQAKDLFESDTNYSQRVRTPPLVQARQEKTSHKLEVTPHGALPRTAAPVECIEEDYEADQLRMSSVVPGNRDTLEAQETSQMYNTMTGEAAQDMIQAEQTTLRDSFQRSMAARETEPNEYLEDFVNQDGSQDAHIAQERDLINTENPAIEGINDTPFFAPPGQQLMNLKDVSDYLSSQQNAANPQHQLSGGRTMEDGLSNPPALEMSPTQGKRSETIEVEDVISAGTNPAALRNLDHNHTLSNVFPPAPIANEDAASQERAEAEDEALQESSSLVNKNHYMLYRNNVNQQYSSTKGNVVASSRDMERIEANRSQNAKSSLAVMQRLDNPIAINQHESAPDVVDPIDQLKHDSIESAHLILAHSKNSKHIQTSDPLQKQMANIPDYQSQVNYTNSLGQVPQLQNSAFDTGLDDPQAPQPAVHEQRGSYIGSSSIVESQISETVMTQKSSIIEENTSAPGMMYSGKHDSSKKDDTVANMPQPARRVPDHPGMKLVESSPDNLTDEQVTVVDVKSQVGDGPTFIHQRSLQPYSPVGDQALLSRNDDSHTTIEGAKLPGGQNNIGGSHSRGAPPPELTCVLRQGSDMTMQTEKNVEYQYNKIGKVKKLLNSFAQGKNSIGAQSVQQKKQFRDTISIEQSIQSVSQITEFAAPPTKRPPAEDRITPKCDSAEHSQAPKHVFVIQSGQTTVQNSRNQRVGSDMSPIETPRGSLPCGQGFIQEDTLSQARACVSGGAANWTRSSVATEDASKAMHGVIKHRKAPIKVPVATVVSPRKGSLNQPRTQQPLKQKVQTTSQSRPPKATPVPVRPKPLPKAIHNLAAVAHSSGLMPKNQSALTTPLDYNQAIVMDQSALNQLTGPPLPLEYSNYQTELVEYNQTSQSRVYANGMAVATDATATEPGIYNEDRVVKIAEKISKLNFQLIQFQNDIEDQKKDPILKSTHRSNASKRNLASQKSRETALTVPLGQTMNPTVAQAAKISQLQELRSNGQLQSAPGRSRPKPGSRQRATPEGNPAVGSNEFLIMEPRQSIDVMTTGQQAFGSGPQVSQPALGLKEDDVDNCTSETHTHVVRP